MSVKNKQTTPISAIHLPISSGATSQLEIQGISGTIVSSTQIGNKYTLLKDLGEGTFGSVKLGKQN